MQEIHVRSLGWEDPLEEEMTTHSSILAWGIPRTEEPGGLQSWGHKESDTTEHAHARRWLSGKEPTCQCRRLGFDPWARKVP